MKLRDAVGLTTKETPNFQRRKRMEKYLTANQGNPTLIIRTKKKPVKAKTIMGPRRSTALPAIFIFQRSHTNRVEVSITDYPRVRTKGGLWHLTNRVPPEPASSFLSQRRQIASER